MEIRNKKINNNNWQLVNEYWEKGYSWGHRTIVFKNGYEMVEHKCKYINRTWESYTYETCMLCAIDEIEETEKKEPSEVVAAKEVEEPIKEPEKEKTE